MTAIVTLTDEEVCLLADPSQPRETREPALAEIERRRSTELLELDPSCFEGNAESGPFVPLTSIERLRSETSSRLLRERVQAELRDRQERFPAMFTNPAMTLMDVCFRIASDDPYHPSPSWVRRFAGELGLCPRLERYSMEEAAYRYRMDAESIRRYQEKRDA